MGRFRTISWGLGVLLGLVLAPTPAGAYTANKVWFEFHPTGIYRVVINYTVPELKEYREAYVEFRQKKAAEKFYWDLIRGADFYPTQPKLRRFTAPPAQGSPW